MKIVVIGGGVAGLSIGWRLQQAGAQVTVLERAQPGCGATWASAGMIAVLAEGEDDKSAFARLARHSAALWPHFAHELEEESKVGVSYRVDGTLLIARTEEEAAALRLRAKDSAALEYLVSEEARTLEPLLADNISGALFDPDEAQVDNRVLGPALALAFRRAGGVLQTNEAVVRLEIEHSRAVGARTPFTVHRADVFVLAAGAWSARIEGLPAEAVPPVVPVKGEMIALAPKHDPIPKHMIWGNDIYLVPRRDRLLVGATLAREGFDTAVSRAAAQWLYDRAVELAAALENWELVEHWAGLRPGSPDDLPMIGHSPVEGLLVASGQYRNGILLAPAIAEAMRGIILENTIPVDVRLFDPRRFAA